jgi:rubrerythrin
MKTIVINTENDSIAKLLSDLAKNLGLTSQVLTDKKKEDLALMRAIDEGMKGEKLSVKTSYAIIDKLLK